MQELPGAFPPGDSLGFCPGPTAEMFARRKRVNNYFFPFQWSLGCRHCKGILDISVCFFFSKLSVDWASELKQDHEDDRKFTGKL